MIKYKGKVFIYDAFIRNGELYLISTHWEKKETHPIVKVNDMSIAMVSHNTHLTPVCYYKMNAPSSKTITVMIDTEKHTLTVPVITPRPGNFAVATLFKHDYARIPLFVEYYRSQGVNKFYLYYNGPKLPNDCFKAPDIEYRCWDYIYWNHYPDTIPDKWGHCAQVTFLTTIRWRHMPDYKWFGLVDLDEWVITKSGVSLQTYLNSIDKSYNSVSVRNHWAARDDNIITYTKKPLKWGTRSKCFYKNTFMGEVSIHSPISKSNLLNTTDLEMLHIVDDKEAGVSCGKQKRIESIVEPIAKISVESLLTGKR